MWYAHDFMRRAGKVLRAQDYDFTHQPLPERWVDLIRHLDELERKRSEARQPETLPPAHRVRQSN